ncbi:MAG: cold shock domain-containing protein [Candidatus Eisenbacteria sp.]|nr:cold shock domain-containing protein [Candidatus Eisenbacteria bacterium]
MPERGRIKWFNNQTGWGFIERNVGPDIYARHDRILGEGYKVLCEGDLVEFEIRKGKQGPYAVKINRLAGRVAGGQERAS